MRRKMPDLMDAAQALALERQEALSRAAQLPVRPMGPPECGDCGNDIPERRRALGAVLCVPCAEAIERVGRHFAGGRR